MSFIDGGDRIVGYVQLIDGEESFPFEKKLSATRHITIGFIRSSLPGKELPKRVKITIQYVHKAVEEGLSFNLVGYKKDDGNYIMNYSTAKPNSSIQFKLDTLTEEYVSQYFESKLTDVNLFLDPIYEEESKKWIIPVFIPIQDEMGGNIPVIIYLVLIQDYYQKFNDSFENISKLLLRFSNWIFDVNDFNKENISKLSSQLNDLLDKNLEPKYFEMGRILQLPELDRGILVTVLKEHKSGGITLSLLSKQLQETPQKVSAKVNELIKKGILRKYNDNGQTIIDTLWIV
ncbi:MAG: hypothetical protein ACFFDS_10590, partial [Candidatus Thorarchaeota archaeon]